MTDPIKENVPVGDETDLGQQVEEQTVLSPEITAAITAAVVAATQTPAAPVEKTDPDPEEPSEIDVVRKQLEALESVQKERSSKDFMNGMKEKLGAELYTGAIEWAENRDNLSEGEFKMLSEMVSKGGLEGEMALEKIASMYQNSENFVEDSHRIAGTVSVNGTTAEALSVKDYARLHHAAVLAGDTAEISRLDARRLATKRMES